MGSKRTIANLLASYLLEAVVNENICEVQNLIRNNASPNTIVDGKGYAAIHYCAGMENTEFSEKAMAILLENKGDPNVQTVEEHLTPLHIACMGGHGNIVQQLMKHGGDINVVDEENMTPIQYAIDELHYDIVMLIKSFIFEQKMEKKKSNLLQVPKCLHGTTKLLSLQKLEDSKFTPNRRHYNYDSSSPYYVSIGQQNASQHRHDNSKPLVEATSDACVLTPNEVLMESTRVASGEITDGSPDRSNARQNLFNLTENNLQEFTRVYNPNHSRNSLVHIWRERVKQPSKHSIVQLHKNLDELLTEFEVDSTKETSTTESSSVVTVRTSNRFAAPPCDDGTNESFHTATENNPTNNNNVEAEEDFIRSPNADTFIVQVAEDYVHTDNESGLVFYEKKLLPSNITKRNIDPNCSHSSLSTTFTLPSDYGTDLLRAELTMFGHVPGPITKSTKRLYLKRLIKFKRNKEKYAKTAVAATNNLTQNFSIELRKTIKNEEWFETIDKYLDLEKEMTESIKKLPIRSLREGHLKTSFVYLLIDPRVSDNLPGQYKFLTKSETWEKFLTSIFYVGKGKSSRPYSHLYDAIQFYNGLAEVENKDNLGICELKNLKIADPMTNQIDSEEVLFADRKFTATDRILATTAKNGGRSVSSKKQLIFGNSMVPPKNGQQAKKQIELTKKLERILSIWRSNSGVVCLHLFHNITPTEAYTREASIIDCITLNYLTNLKGGDYYGVTKTWTMRLKKNLGVGLLYRAMQTYLAQGESQLLPKDLL